ncbi:MAG TPA: M20/M25/M40 family metallo-hydrolase, partial [Kofleriaceae bacterium]|nr:M20/M25/M40 family metallo-hydrolase [Kofleriaceae bacterium]
MLRSRRAILLCGAIGCAGAGEPPGGGEIRVAAVLEHARVLAEEIGPRPNDSEAAARAADHIERALGDLAVERVPVGRVEVPPTDVGPFRWLEGRTVEVADANLVVRFAGAARGPAILFMAHYDSVGGSPGAADNAAGVGLLLELARALRARPPARPVLIAFTAAEESGLVGARALAARLAAGGPPIGLAVSLDLVGGARTALNGLSELVGAGWLRWIAERVDESGADVEVPVPHRVVSRLAPAAERSDHGAFTERGVPAFHLYGRGPDRIFLAYHTAWDLPARLDSGAIDSAARLVTAIARAPGELPDAGGDPGLWLPGTTIV